MPGIHAIGDVTDRINLTPVAIAEGRGLAATLFDGNPTRMDHAGVASAVFSQPPIGTVGLTEEEATKLGPVDVYTALFRPMKHTLSGRDEKTLMKLVVDRGSQVVVGAHMVGADAPEIIQALAIAVKAGSPRGLRPHHGHASDRGRGVRADARAREARLSFEGERPMSFHLSTADAERYARDGYVFPYPVLTPAEIATARGRIEGFERTLGGPLPKELRHKPHLYSKTIDDIMRKPEILDRVESLIGPDIFCWESVLFIKEPRDPAFISWHQDVTYWGLEPYEILTAWVALSPSNRKSGCMRVLPGSHVGEIAPHKDTFAPNNMLSRGQEMQVEVDERRTVDIVLEPGEMSLHHVRSRMAPIPTPPTTGASASRSATSPPMCARRSARATPRRWYAAATASAISRLSRGRPPISRPRASRSRSGCASGGWRS